MCIAPTDRDHFFAKGRAKGWSDHRIERAWAAHESQRGREDARTLLEAPAPKPKPLVVGDRVSAKEGSWRYTGVPGEILAVDGIEAWVRFDHGERHTYALHNLERWNRGPTHTNNWSIAGSGL